MLTSLFKKQHERNARLPAVPTPKSDPFATPHYHDSAFQGGGGGGGAIGGDLSQPPM
jgi:hypothetical protein